ncbi:MAG: hypothetical protein IJ640_07945 [Prevotella sp.]|nr:hypothetical protein [Prevotella sp.]
MKSLFKFKEGDLLKVSKEQKYICPFPDSKHYSDNLRVEFAFWDGNENVYVVSADGIGMLISESYAELQETAPEKEILLHEKSKSSHFLGYVYQINNRYVAAKSIEDAIRTFRSHPSHNNENIESIMLKCKDLALIQREED